MVVAVTLIHLAAIATGIVVLLAAIQKTRNLESFRETLRLLDVPAAVVPAAALIVVALEVAVAVALVSGQWPLLAASAGIVLTLGFAGASIYGLLSARDVPCGCFGRSTRVLGAATLPLAVSMLATQLLYGAAAITGGVSRVDPWHVASLAAGALAIVVVTRLFTVVPKALRVRSHRLLIAARWCADPGA